MGAKDYKAAETQFRTCLANAAVIETMPPNTIMDLKLELASACQGSRNFAGQQSLLLELLESDITKVQRLNLQHSLAVAYLDDSQLDLARQYANEAMKGRQRVFGKQHELHQASLSLLVDICVAQNDDDEADVYRHLLAPVLPPEIFEKEASRVVESSSENTAIKWLSKNGYDVENKDTYFEALSWASTRNKVDVVELLLRLGSDFTGKSKYGYTMLICASKHGFPVHVQRIINQGANVEAKDNDGNEALHYASMRGHHNVVQLLLGRQTNVNTRNNIKNTPLHLAADEGHVAVVRLLLNRGALTDIKGFLGDTPLHVAAIREHFEVVRLLLAHGANPNMINSEKRTAYDIAKKENHVQVVEILKEKRTGFLKLW
jgi:ankyrin repeat protein